MGSMNGRVLGAVLLALLGGGLAVRVAAAGKLGDGEPLRTASAAAAGSGAAAETRHTLTIAPSGDGFTSPAPGSWAFASGTAVAIRAIPASGATFVGWSGAASGTENPVIVVMDGNKALTARFAAGAAGTGATGTTLATATYTLAVSAAGDGSTSPAPGSWTFASGTRVSIRAIPASGTTFTGWSGAATGTDNPVTFVMDGNLALTASFSSARAAR